MPYLLHILTIVVLLAGSVEVFAQSAPLQLQPKKPAAVAPAKPGAARAAPADHAAIIARANEFLNSVAYRLCTRDR